MTRKKLTAENYQFIHDNYLKMSGKAMSQIFECDSGVVYRYMRSQGLHVPKELSRKFASSQLVGRTKVTPEQDKLIKKLYLKVPIKRLARQIGIGDTALILSMKRLNLVVPREIIEQRIIDARIKKGSIPPNKGKKQTDYMSQEQINKTIATRFKKGQTNHNSLYDGCIRLRKPHKNRPNDKPHLHIRLSKGVWKELQIHNWEKVNGPIPKGNILTCIDGDTLNCDPSNWKLSTRSESAIQNSGQLHLTDKYVAGLLARSGKAKAPVDENVRNLILSVPALVEIKRQQILLNRTINDNETSKSTS